MECQLTVFVLNLVILIYPKQKDTLCYNTVPSTESSNFFPPPGFFPPIDQFHFCQISKLPDLRSTPAVHQMKTTT